MKLDLPTPKPCFFVGSSRKDLSDLPLELRQSFGYSLHEVQLGDKPLGAKALQGFGGRSVLEIVKDFDTDTYRAVYTIRFAEAVYVLHVFQKKSNKGAATPKHVIDLVKSRLRDAEEHYRRNFGPGGQGR